RGASRLRERSSAPWASRTASRPARTPPGAWSPSSRGSRALGRLGASMPGGRSAAASMGQIAELRVLDGPNLYFTRPAIKLTLELPRLVAMPEDRLAHRAEEAGVRSSSPALRPGAPASDRRLRCLARVGAHVPRLAADA